MTPQFKAVVEKYGPRFMADLGLTRLQVAGIFGNFAVESDQFRALQEYKPTVKGSKGGWGWAQWTGYGRGGRRGLFDAWAKAQGYKLDDPEAFYGFTVHELNTSEKAALARLKRTTTLDTATVAFMKGYERPGVPHEDKRKAFALEALRVLDTKIGAVTQLGKPVMDRMAVGEPTATKATDDPFLVPAPAVSRSPFAFLASLFGRKAVAPVEQGDPTVKSVQQQLRDKSYYPIGLIDGVDSTLFRDAVAAARKDIGMGDGGMDAAFLAALPSMPRRPVSTTRANMGVAEVLAYAPERASPISTLTKVGGFLGALGGLDAAKTAGIIGSAQTAIDSGTYAIGTVQSGLNVVAQVGTLLWEWRQLIIWLGVAFVALKVLALLARLFGDVKNLLR